MPEFDHAAFAQQNVADHLARSRKGEAKFAAPEALATAVGAGFILGPVGGLLLGAAQGILGKRERQSELDAIAREEGILAESNELFFNSVNRQMAFTENQHDKEQLNTLATQYSAASKMLRSSNEETRRKGAALQADAFAGLQSYTVRQEEQAIAAQSKEEMAVRELGQENYRRYTDSRDNFMAESAPYMEVRGATVNLVNSLNRGTPVDQYAAIKLLEKALDPRSVVRPEEQEAWGALGSAYDRVDVFKQRLESGKTLLPEQVQQVKDLAYSIEEQSYEMQVARETRYADEIDDIGLPGKYHNNFKIAERLEPIVPAEVPDRGDGKPDFSNYTDEELIELRKRVNEQPR